MTFRYQSGEEIRKGDRVLFHGIGAKIELVAFDANDPEQAWYVQEEGGGIMISDPVSGRTFIPRDQVPNCEDLEFMARAETLS
jgi:hypothetical protein